MDSKKPDNCLHGEKRKAAMQLKRRDTYNQISPTRRDALLLSRRMRKQDTARHNLTESAIVAVSEQATSSLYKAGFPKQTALTIREPHALLEKGCTSGTSDHCVSTLSTVPTKGHTHAKNICLATREQRDAYVSLKKVANCQYCAAKRFEYEPPTFCCGSGSIRLTAYKMPIELSKLYFENTEESEYFQTYIRTYNNMFIFTSLGVKYDKELAKRNCGIYTFRVQGQMYHFIDDLVPSNEKPKNLQLYFYDRDNELANRMAYSSRVNESIVQKLMGILKVNSYTVFLRSLLNVPKLADFYIALRCDSTLGQRTYNLPSASEIAAIWKENSGKENSGNTISAPHIRIYTHSNRAQLVNYYYDYYDPLQYPLLFSYGKNGWHCGIKIITHMNNLTRNRVLCEHEQLPSIENMCINRFSEWPKIPVLLQFCNSENRNIVSSIAVESNLLKYVYGVLSGVREEAAEEVGHEE